MPLLILIVAAGTLERWVIFLWAELTDIAFSASGLTLRRVAAGIALRNGVTIWASVAGGALFRHGVCRSIASFSGQTSFHATVSLADCASGAGLALIGGLY